MAMIREEVSSFVALFAANELFSEFIMNVSLYFCNFIDKTIHVMTKNTQDLAENRIKAVLADKKKTCRWLAEQIGKNENTVSRWCTNKIQPSMQQLFDIARILEVDVRVLIKTPDSIY